MVVVDVDVVTVVEVDVGSVDDVVVELGVVDDVVVDEEEVTVVLGVSTASSSPGPAPAAITTAIAATTRTTEPNTANTPRWVGVIASNDSRSRPMRGHIRTSPAAPPRGGLG